MQWLSVDPEAIWPYGLGGVVTGFIATLTLVGGPAPRQLMADAMRWGAPPIVRTQSGIPPQFAQKAAASDSPAKPSGSNAAMALAPAEPRPEVSEAAAAMPIGTDKPPYPSPLMPCRRLANGYHQSIAGPDGPPGFRCRQLRAEN